MSSELRDYKEATEILDKTFDKLERCIMEFNGFNSALDEAKLRVYQIEKSLSESGELMRQQRNAYFDAKINHGNAAIKLADTISYMDSDSIVLKGKPDAP